MKKQYSNHPVSFWSLYCKISILTCWMAGTVSGYLFYRAQIPPVVFFTESERAAVHLQPIVLQALIPFVVSFFLVSYGNFRSLCFFGLIRSFFFSYSVSFLLRAVPQKIACSIFMVQWFLWILEMWVLTHFCSSKQNIWGCIFAFSLIFSGISLIYFFLLPFGNLF